MPAPLIEIKGMLIACQSNGAVPRVHGNGFIQIDVPWDDKVRINVWGHPDIPCQDSPSPIHDHRFGFISKIYKGVMTNHNLVYSHLHHAPTHQVYNPVCREGEDTILVPENQSYVADKQIDLLVGKTQQFSQSYVPGETYEMRPFEFHETGVCEPTITVIQKFPVTVEYDSRKAQVLVPIGAEPDNKFTRDNTTAEELWRIIQETLKA